MFTADDRSSEHALINVIELIVAPVNQKKLIFLTVHPVLWTVNPVLQQKPSIQT